MIVCLFILLCVLYATCKATTNIGAKYLLKYILFIKVKLNINILRHYFFSFLYTRFRSKERKDNIWFYIDVYGYILTIYE